MASSRFPYFQALTLMCALFAVSPWAHGNPVTSITISLPASPEERILSEKDRMKPVNFKWTPVIPRPTEPVTYRLRVWQLMQGQTGPQAARVNQPIVTKDVDNLTQTLIEKGIPGSGKPPYLNEFVWSVQALNRDGKPVGGNNGMSELGKFGFRK
ncbi:MAG: hypothetical protein KBF26_06765 [Opitutaceae bacterium]|nr:hypothetical protein [Opitutaceae bacterium]